MSTLVMQVSDAQIKRIQRDAAAKLAAQKRRHAIKCAQHAFDVADHKYVSAYEAVLAKFRRMEQEDLNFNWNDCDIMGHSVLNICGEDATVQDLQDRSEDARWRLRHAQGLV